MSTIGSSRTRITGMSGFDTETMVSQLMRAESMKLTQLQQKYQIMTWQQEAYRGVTTNLKTFQDKFLNFANMSTNFKSQTMFSSLKVSVTGSLGSEIKGVSVKSSSGAQNTTANLKIESFASKDTYVGNTFNTSVAGGEEADLSSIKEGDSFDITLDGRTTNIRLEADDFKDVEGEKVLDIDKLNEKLLKIFGTEIGGASKVSFGSTENDKWVLKTTPGHSIKISNSSDKTSFTSKNLDISKLNGEALEFKVGGQSISVRTDGVSSKSELVERINEKLKSEGLSSSLLVSLEGEEIKFTAKENDITIKAVDDSMKNLGFALANGEEKTLTTKDVVQLLGFENGASNTKTEAQTLNELFGGLYEISENSKFVINGKTIELKEDGTDTIDDFVKKVNESGAGVTMKYSKITNSFRIESNEMGSVNKIDFGGSDRELIEGALGFIGALGFDGNDTVEEAKYIAASKASHITEASDAIVWIDGKRTSRTSNTFDIADGLSVTLDPGVNNIDEEMTIKATPDTESTITNIKKFVEEYNTLLEGLNNAYGQKREKSSKYEYYEPLTDEQKGAMSEKDIEKWEEKAKSGLLYRDGIVGKIATDLRSWMNQSVKLEGGGSISLYEIGIDSTHWSDLGKLTINEDKLRQALEERPDDVAALFNQDSGIQYSDKANRGTRMENQGLAYRLDDIIENSIKTNYDKDGFRGTLIEKAGMKGTASDIINNMYDALKDQDDRIYQMITRLNDKEDYYYRMFSAMESAMSKYNSQSSWLSQQQFA